jgi:hypothetical protein
MEGIVLHYGRAPIPLATTARQWQLVQHLHEDCGGTLPPIRVWPPPFCTRADRATLRAILGGDGGPERVGALVDNPDLLARERDGRVRRTLSRFVAHWVGGLGPQDPRLLARAVRHAPLDDIFEAAYLSDSESARLLTRRLLEADHDEPASDALLAHLGRSVQGTARHRGAAPEASLGYLRANAGRVAHLADAGPLLLPVQPHSVGSGTVTFAVVDATGRTLVRELSLAHLGEKGVDVQVRARVHLVVHARSIGGRLRCCVRVVGSCPTAVTSISHPPADLPGMHHSTAGVRIHHAKDTLLIERGRLPYSFAAGGHAFLAILAVCGPERALKWMRPGGVFVADGAAFALCPEAQGVFVYASADGTGSVGGPLIAYISPDMSIRTATSGESIVVTPLAGGAPVAGRVLLRPPLMAGTLALDGQWIRADLRGEFGDDLPKTLTLRAGARTVRIYAGMGIAGPEGLALGGCDPRDFDVLSITAATGCSVEVDLHSAARDELVWARSGIRVVRP